MSQISSMAILAIYLVGTVRIYLVRNMVHLQQLGTGYFEKTVNDNVSIQELMHLQS